MADNPEKTREMTATAYKDLSRKVGAERGPVTRAAEQQVREGRGINRLVNPREFGGYRECLRLLVPHNGRFLMKFPLPIPVTTHYDTTASMGDNIDLAYRAVLESYKLLVKHPLSPLRRYWVQMAHGIIQDELDNYAFLTTQYEPDIKIAEQLTMLTPDRYGYDDPEEYQVGLWFTGYRTNASIFQYGLKGHYSIIGDERGRDYLTQDLARKVAGVNIPNDIPARELGREVLKNHHAFFYQIGDEGYVTRYWVNVLGQEHVIVLPRTEYFPYAQAVVIGLTEGTIDLQSAADFLVETTQEGCSLRLSKMEANRIVRAVSHIPLRAQADLPGFNDIPTEGAIFDNEDDFWPSGHLEEADGLAPASAGGGEINWQL